MIDILQENDLIELNGRLYNVWLGGGAVDPCFLVMSDDDIPLFAYVEDFADKITAVYRQVGGKIKKIWSA